MGQKVHPLGFRVGITKKHQSQWFARFHKNSYAQSVVEDRMLRNTLIKLFPDLLNPVLKKIQNRQQETKVTPKITQIKIERGLIPYEIGIQIHAQNCELIKSAIDKLKIDRDLACYLQRAQKFLIHLGQKSKLDLEKMSINSGTEIQKLTETSLSELKKKKLKRAKVRSNAGSVFGRSLSIKKSRQGRFKRGPKLTKQQYKRKKLIQRRLKRRQNVRLRFNEFIAKGLLIKTTGIEQTALSSEKKQKSIEVIQRKLNSKRKKLNRVSRNRLSILRPGGKKLTQQSKNQISNETPTNKVVNRPQKTLSIKGKSPVFTRIKKKIQKKFLSIYLNKMNKNFLKELKKMMKIWAMPSSNNSVEGASPNSTITFGYSKKWDLNKLKSFKNQPIPKLMKLVQILEKKISKKMEALKKYFIIFGSLSKTQAYSFYQIMVFLKSLKGFIRQRFFRLRLGLTSQYTTQQKGLGNQSDILSLISEHRSGKLDQSNLKTKKVLLKIVNNLGDECRKIKFIEYLKQIVKKHRTKNIFYYLSTLSKAQKELNQTKKFTIKNAQFLFGFDLQNTANSQEANVIKDRVTKVLEQTNRNKIYGNQDFEQVLRDSLISQIEKQKQINKENLKLTPKISIKFYSVKKQSLEIKASVVAESIVDALEKRKAFRAVIKKAKEELMKKQRVKGVKIQVAGRLNGAEIARTEWVRAGRVPLQTLRANIDFSYQTANTIYGIIGVKVWIFKGYTRTI